MRPILAVFAMCSFCLCATGGPVRADGPKKPLLLFFEGSNRIDLGGAYAEIEYGKVLDRVRERLTRDLGTTFATTISSHAFGGADPSGREIAQACAALGAVGAISVADSFGDGVDDTFRGAFTIDVRDCTGSEFFSETGASVHGPGKAEIADVVMPAMEEALARIEADVADSPLASENYERYGIYMTSREADSFWSPAIDAKRTIVDTCEALGTASRAGLRPGDEIRAIDGIATIGIDTDALNVAMKHALGMGSWTLEIANGDKTTRTVTFQNQTVAWYAAHPLGPADIPTPPPTKRVERPIPFTY